MKKSPQDTRLAPPTRTRRGMGFYYSLLLHAAVLVVLFVGLDWTTQQPAPTPPGDSQVLNVTTVDPKAVAREVSKLKAAEQAKQREADQKVKEAEQQRLKEEKELERIKTEKENLKREKEAENRRLDAEKERLQQEKEQAAQEKLRVEAEKQKVLQEKKKAEEEHKAQEQKKAEEAKKAEQKKKTEEEAKKAEADKKKKAEDAKKAEADKKKKAETDKKAAEEKRKAAEAKALADEMADEEAEAAAANQSRQDQSAIARYTAAIMRQVANNFVAPDLKSGLKCTLLIRMIPGGEVVEARVIKSSGNTTFDRQAELAVRKASPLPVPEEERLFAQVKNIQFEFDPSGMSQ